MNRYLKKGRRATYRFIVIFCVLMLTTLHSFGQDTLLIDRTEDFTVDGYGSSAKWQQTTWIELEAVTMPDSQLSTKAKILYSEQGIYFLFLCEDQELTATFTQDFSDLWKEDVVEVFLWPDSSHTIYFEYELSPKNIELPILIPNVNQKFLGWRPWKYSGSRRVQHETSVQMVTTAGGASISGWTAEFFIPYELLIPIVEGAPQPGELWRANFYRLDYDGGQQKRWTWQRTEKHFHEYWRFGYFKFR